jgi:hypothetical protein
VELMEDASVQAGIGGTPAGLRSPRFAELDTQIQAEAEQRQNRPTAKRSPRNRGEAEAFMLVPSIGGLERKVADLGDIGCPAWTPDSKWLAIPLRDSPQGPYSIWLSRNSPAHTVP